MATSSKRKRVVLSLEEKKGILQALERGVSGRSISEKYGIGPATVADIKRKGRTILDYSEKWAQEGGCSNRKVMRTAKLEEVEEALYVWFVQKRAAGVPMTGPLLCEKALEFNSRLGADPDFKASQGWLGKFKRRHGIHGREICGEKLSGDQLSADAFRGVLHSFMEEGGYDGEFVYNADEAGLNWRSLPTRSLVAHHEAHTSGHKARKERVTVMVCANSVGSHRLPLFIIGKPANPRSFRNVRRLPVVYSHQKKAWMNVHVFNEWFERTFIPEVKRYQSSIGKTGKVLLIIDNAPAHPSAERLNRIDEMVTVKFLPPNVSSLIQPMDQGVIGTLKLLYRKQLLRQLLSSGDDTPESVANFYKRITLKDFCYMAAESWTLLKQATLRGSWNKLLIRRGPAADPGDWDADPDVNREVEEILDALRSTSISDDCGRADVERWLASDAEDRGLQTMDDEEILEFISKEPAESEEEPQHGDEEEQERPAAPSDSEAFRCAEVLMKWYEGQDECAPQRLLCLKSIRDLAASKRRSVYRQTLLTDFIRSG